MTADRRAALVEKVAKAIEQSLCTARLHPTSEHPWSQEARIAISLIRAEVLEEAAQTAETCEWWTMPQCDERASIAAVIRALKDKT